MTSLWLLIVISWSGGYKADILAEYKSRVACEEMAQTFRTFGKGDTFECVEIIRR